ncbi:MAG: aspartate--tRNA ligase [Candidatus Riflebacteria bacterium]|nr:aspartate--tRNA ligase [Candidatus Riflebacteria bacterium]
MQSFQSRSHYCGELSLHDLGSRVILYGWIHKLRDLGGILFAHLRDVSGICQVVFSPGLGQGVHERAQQLRAEYAVKIEGQVRERPEGNDNPLLTTGELEVVVDGLEILNTCDTPPFSIAEDQKVSEQARFQFRYLDLRKPANQEKILFRSKVLSSMRRYLEEQRFFELETPILTRSTPEGARDFLVPSRLSQGHFYALPQSPQLFKQIYMVAGFDRYFQVCRCFRDEDLRADRQPEFTQLDLETSFTPPEELFRIVDGLMGHLAQTVVPLMNVPEVLPRMTYREAMERFGTDKPDLRFGMELRDVSDLVGGTEYTVFRDALGQGGRVEAMAVPGGGSFSRGELDDLVERAKQLGAMGLGWVRRDAEKFQSPLVKYLGEPALEAIFARLSAGAGDLVLFQAGAWKPAVSLLGILRLELGRRLSLVPEGTFAFTWVTEFPWLEFSEEEGRPVAMHHPFTKPFLEDLERHAQEPLRIRAQAYDLVLNGNEIGGGSVRIHQSDLQERMFALLKISREEAREKFGFLLDALRYGAPPHAGIALGVDRLLALFLGESSIREVIAFPKTQRGLCPMTGAPGLVGDDQMRELGLKFRPE